MQMRTNRFSVSLLAAVLVIALMGMFTSTLYGQQPLRVNDGITILRNAPAPISVRSISGTPSAAGSNNYYYWLAVNYPRGAMFPVGPVTVANAATVPAATVTLRWSAVPGAETYTVVRTATANFPTIGTCVACAATTAALTFVDNGAVLVNNFATSGINSSSATLLLNIADQDYDFLEVPQPFVIAPLRGTAAYSYLFQITDPRVGQMIGRGNQKTYALGITVTRPAGYGATGDSNDATIRASYSNYAVNDNNFIMRGINTSTTNRNGGTLGMIEGGALGSSNRGASTVQTLRGLAVNVENMGFVVAEHSGIDVTLKNEGAKATLEYGVRVRNINNSLATRVDAAYLVSDAGANLGFTYGLDLGSATIVTDVRGKSLDTISNAAAGYWSIARGSGAFTGLSIEATAFGDLPAAANGTIMYCSNCDPAVAGAGPTVCASAGAATGAMAFRVAGAWTCLGI